MEVYLFIFILILVAIVLGIYLYFISTYSMAAVSNQFIFTKRKNNIVNKNPKTTNTFNTNLTNSQTIYLNQITTITQLLYTQPYTPEQLNYINQIISITENLSNINNYYIINNINPNHTHPVITNNKNNKNNNANPQQQTTIIYNQLILVIQQFINSGTTTPTQLSLLNQISAITNTLINNKKEQNSVPLKITPLNNNISINSSNSNINLLPWDTTSNNCNNDNKLDEYNLYRKASKSKLELIVY